MPDSIKKILADKIWSLLESRTQFTAIVLAGNRAKQTSTGWLKEAIARAPNDFPQVSLACIRFKAGGFDAPMIYGGQATGYGSDAGTQLVRDRYEFELTITAKDLVTNTLDIADEEVRNALLIGGKTWGLSYMLEWEQMTARRRQVNVAKHPRLQSIIPIRIELEFLGQSNIVRT